MRLSRPTSALGLAGFLTLFVTALLGCESEPCIGDACPGACNGAPCDASADGAGANGDVQGRFVSCSSDASCDAAHGFECVEGSCLPRCSSHFDCSGVGLCRDVAGGTFCSPEPDAGEQGRFFTSCPSGGECDDAGGFFCLGAGVGDLDAYCTTSCASDDDCPTGFFCESSQATPCEDMCNVAGDASDPECIPASEIGPGKEYDCSPLGPERNQCVKKRFCAECETDEDCRAVPGLICARDIEGNKICTPPCDQATGSCPWGNAAICGVWDEERGVATCSHRYGSCKGQGEPCAPCVRDRDCGENGLCYGSSFTGERYCIDFSPAASCSCAGEPVSGGVCEGGGCPLTPGGLDMLCYVGGDPDAAGLCYGANSSDNPLLGSPQTGCWGPL